MELIAKNLQNLIDEWTGRMDAIPDEKLAEKPEPTRWSKKEIIGHLIDSAQNNLRRFICSQYESVPPKIFYDQNFWVIANDYQHMRKEDIIALWRLINFRIVTVLSNMPKQNYSLECDTGNQSTGLHSLLFIAEDYLKHSKHHLNQIVPNHTL